MDNGTKNYLRFIDGDKDGMTEIIKEYKDGLILYINSFTGNLHTAEELMEDTFVKLVVKKPHFSAKYSFKTWLYTIGRNTALDYLRRSSKSRDLSFDELSSLSDYSTDIENEYLRSERKIIVHRALQRVKDDYRSVIYLSYFENFDNRQIAKIMKKSARQVENLLYRSKQALKKELEKEGFVYEEL